MGRVYTTESGSISEEMLKNGWAIKNDKEGYNDPADQKATEYARKHWLGIFSPLCTQTENLINPTCTIKGNVVSGDSKTYHLRGCPSYDMTILQLHIGDRWFCTETQAQKAGFTKAKSCGN